jgi:hypothetical protein
MRPSLALKKHRKKVMDILSASCAMNPRVFGSVAKGEDSEASDLDLLIDLKPNTSLFDLAGLQIELEEALKIKVDIMTSGGIPMIIREEVLASARPL